MGYYVIAHDGNRYGPADIATLQQWVREGRIAPNTTLEDEFTGTQIRASLLPELSHLFPQGAAPPPTQAPPVPMAGGGPSSQATTALVLGILSLLCCGLLSIPAYIVGKQELDRINRGLSPVEGRGLAQAGYILGIIGMVLLGLAVLYVVVVLVIAAMSSPY
ncbi:MAG: DUF4190 domain-containing protein [Chthonomonadetes bacterium]|nr:DUF4190 domain-containing protein [Chthonomonadetes bacterium]